MTDRSGIMRTALVVACVVILTGAGCSAPTPSPSAGVQRNAAAAGAGATRDLIRTVPFTDVTVTLGETR